MRYIYLTLALIGIAAAAVASTNLANFSQSQALNLIRPCTPKPAGNVNITGAAASSTTSSQLSSPSKYLVWCDTAAYIDTSPTSTCTASSADAPLAASQVLEFIITPDAQYVCARNVTVDGNCHLLECL